MAEEEMIKESNIGSNYYSTVKYGTNSRVRVRDRYRQWSDIGLDIVISLQQT